MTLQTKAKVRSQCAEADMTLAQSILNRPDCQPGDEISIAETKRGLLGLSYNAETKTYKLFTQKTMRVRTSEVLAEGSKKVVKPVLAELYVLYGEKV